MNVRIVNDETKIDMTKPERQALEKSKLILRAYARVTPSDEQREAITESVEEIGKVLAGSSEEALVVG